ncbi:metal ABC transporter permease, partial [Bordetella pertussis]
MPSPSPTPAGRNSLDTLRTLAPFLWPADRPGLKARVVIAILCLLAAKAAVVYVPILYKSAVDQLGGGAPGAVTVPL